MMILRTLGNTGIKVSPLGLGTAALGRPGYITLGHGDDLGHAYEKAVMQENACQIFQAAYDAGIRYFDTARSYGLAESFMRVWLNGKNPSVSTGSKWGYYYTGEWKVSAQVHEIKDHSLERLKIQWSESYRHLSKHLNLYQVHSVTSGSAVLDNPAIHAYLDALKDKYGISIGLSLSGEEQPQVLKQVMNIKVGGRRLFDAVQATYNILETRCEDALKEAHSCGMGVIIKEALANGRLTSKNQQDCFSTVLQNMACDYGVTVDAIALAFVLQQDWVDVVLSGAVTENQLNANLQAINVSLTNTDIGRLSALKEKKYWENRKTLKWN